MKNEKTKKIIRYCDRLFDTSSVCAVHVVTPPRRSLVFTQEVDSKTRKISKKSEYRTVDRHAEMKNYRVSDFCMENLQAIGAVATLKPATLSQSTLKAHANLNLPNLENNNTKTE